MASINTNYGASIALQNLNKTNSELERTQNRINTGMKVSSAKDSGAIYSIATSQRAAAASQDAVRAGLQRTQSITDVALAAGDTITAALEEMKGLAVSIAGSTGAAQTSYLAEYNALGTEIASAITGASFDGVNSLTALGSNAAITAVNTGSITAANATTANVDAAIAATTSTLSTLGTQSKSLGRQISFVNKLQDALEAC
jgi:flagellin